MSQKSQNHESVSYREGDLVDSAITNRELQYFHALYSRLRTDDTLRHMTDDDD